MGEDRCVVGIDVSTQSAKAIAWSPDGRPLAEGRAPLSLSQPKPGHAEQNPDEWWGAVIAALRHLGRSVDPASIEGLAISNQRETMALLDDAGRPIAPATLWLDNRAAETYRAFADGFGPERLHQITGRPVDVISAVNRLDWFARHDPGLLDRARRIVDVQALLALRLTGSAVTGHTSADAFGLFDIVAERWSEPLLAHLGLPASRFPEAVPAGMMIGRITSEAAAATGLRAGTPLYAGGGDGQCAGLGVNAMRPGSAYLNLGTSLVAGAWSAEPVLSFGWRTIMAPPGGFFLEHVQRAGTFFVDYVLETFAGGRAAPGTFAQLEAKASEIPIGAEGLLICPYLVGCMDPHWNPKARATLTGLGAHHRGAHFYRAALEALTLETARALEGMRQRGIQLDQILAIGGGAGSRLWLQMIADATGVATGRSLSNEASSLGAGIIAAFGAGWYASIGDAADAMTRVADLYAPNPSRAEDYARLSRRQAAVYAATLPLHDDAA